MYFSTGDKNADHNPLTESFARTLRGEHAHSENSVKESTYLQDLEEEDPLFCRDLMAQELSNCLFGPDTKSEWFPYPDKAMSSLVLPTCDFPCTAESSPILGKGSIAPHYIFSPPNVSPFIFSFYFLTYPYGQIQQPMELQTQDMLLNEVGDLTKHQESGRGNVWYLNEIGSSIKKAHDMSNLFTWAGMTLYPEDAGNKLGEVWHRDKWLRDIPDDRFTPMIRHNGVIHYVNELIQCSDRSWFLPKCWMTRSNGKFMLASGFKVAELDDGSLLFQDQSLKVVEVSCFESNFLRTSGIYLLAAKCYICFVKKLGREWYIQFHSPSSSTIYQAVNPTTEQTFFTLHVEWVSEAQSRIHFLNPLLHGIVKQRKKYCICLAVCQR
ncbi:hypothetical protein DFH09DRAFT_1081749 [Mycena vulgaris]|nr:hypothetical protein DFH09DRAFT_1081749 [Mycena vulgaris]